MKQVTSDKKFWFGNIVVAASLFFAITFPHENSFQELMIHAVFLFLFPFLFIRWIVGEKIQEYGWQLNHPLRGISWVFGALSILLLLAYLVFRYTGHFNVPSIPFSIRTSFPLFLAYMLVFGLYLFLFEFFFRGFVLFLWERKIGYWAIVVQAFLFELFLFVKIGDRNISLVTALAGIIALLSGVIAYRSRSMGYSFFFSYLSAILGVSVAIVFF